MAVKHDIDFTDFDQDPQQWFVQQSQQYDLRYFLAHDDDGVIWGYVKNNELKLSGKAFPEIAVPLRPKTLQQARLFGDAGELLIWPEGEGWNGRFLNDDNVDPADIINETHRLWGEASDPPGPQNGFTLMRDGVEDLRHAPPIEIGRGERATLTVRHYLDYDAEGQAYIALSRLVSVQ